MWELTTRGFSSDGRTFPGPGGDRGCEPASVPVRAFGPRAFSAVVDHVRLAGIRGGPRGAGSDVGDPTERLTAVTALRLARTRRGAAPGPTRPSQGVSPDSADSRTFAASPPSRLSHSGRIVLRAFGPRPRPGRAGGGTSPAAGDVPADGARLGPPPAASLGASAAARPEGGGSWAAARSRLVRIMSSSIV